ncbi:CDP-glucose 4,6-dehydratase [Bradyrhizobium sp.]|jgi:CDP-glucose 4,6-dehydratase|uniref:CDP-glucose 4,6-dehydratase n=1 Tax=Bradyrhizobium sp. TaxID=376 RepID=UPI002C9AB0C2|nr:CDP-glucose 4,6-dehydratase [Bradyrhizobium sp.]HWX57616.1 CDP-glucose 4,6-dehydratase [Bradyrhizobium sp.]
MAGVNTRFWQGKRVFLTGHTGFKGSWLGAWLTRLGAQVTGFSLAPETKPSHFALLPKEYESLEGDIRDLERLRDALRRVKPDVVLHLAAQSLVRPSYADPVGTYATNVMGTLHVLESIRQVPSVRAALIVTSDKCYENRETMQPYVEGDPIGGHDPYSSSKGCAEILTSSMRRSFFSESACLIASARAGNVIGGGDWATDQLIPDCIRAWTGREPVRIRSPRAVRPWQHVLDPLSGYLQLTEALFAGQSVFAKGWNFGPAADSTWPVEKIVGAVKARLPGFDFNVQPSKEHEAGLLTLDSGQAQRELGWKPRWGIETALEKTLEWYSTYYETGELLTDKQIQEHMRDYSAAKVALPQGAL